MKERKIMLGATQEAAAKTMMGGKALMVKEEGGERRLNKKVHIIQVESVSSLIIAPHRTPK